MFEQKDSRGRMFKLSYYQQEEILFDLWKETMADMKSLWGKLPVKQRKVLVMKDIAENKILIIHTLGYWRSDYVNCPSSSKDLISLCWNWKFLFLSQVRCNSCK